jgi:DNA-binding transcriptional LysR family regulator
MNLADIEAFVIFAEAGSVNRAALRLRLTQPAVTRRVQNFEAAMGGAALLDRRSKPAVLTPAGRQALEYCRRVLASVGDLRQSAAAAGKPVGDLRIGMAHGIADMAITTPLDDLRRRFPDLHLRVSASWTRQLVEEVSNGGLDCAVALVTADRSLRPEHAATALGREQVVVVAAKTLKLSQRRARLRLGDLGGHPWVLNTSGCGYRDTLQRACDRSQTTMRIAAEIIGYDLQLSLVARGAGLGLVPLRRLKASPFRRQLRVLNLDDFALDVTIALLRSPALGNLRTAVDHFQARLVERIAAL